MVGVFRQRGVSTRLLTGPAQPTLLMSVLVLIVTATACANSSTPPVTEVPNEEAIPSSLDGLWILENSDLNLDIDIEVAQVDGRTSCARLLGSLTFLDDGAITSFSLPGRDDQRCTAAEVDEVDDLRQLLQSVASVQAEAGGYRLLNSDAELLGRLRVGS